MTDYTGTADTAPHDVQAAFTGAEAFILAVVLGICIAAFCVIDWIEGRMSK